MSAEAPVQLTLGVDPLADAIAWAARNPAAWKLIVDWAHRDHAAGEPISTRTYVAVLRRRWLIDMLGIQRMPGDPVRVNDHLSSGLARLLNRIYPYLNVPTRRAIVDSYRGAA
jgi:hypothetical protein